MCTLTAVFCTQAHYLKGFLYSTWHDDISILDFDYIYDILVYLFNAQFKYIINYSFYSFQSRFVFILSN